MERTLEARIDAKQPDVQYWNGGTFGLFVFLAALIALAYLRSPDIFEEGRFWAEEGSVYFRFAFHNGPIDTLSFVYKRAGYLNMFANLAALLATAAPLESAPKVTTYLSALIQMVILLLVLFVPTEITRTAGARKIAGLMLLVGPSFTGEVWANSINSQVYFGIAGVWMLTLPPEDLNRATRWVTRLLLAVGGLSGPYVVVLTPLYIVRAIRSRLREEIVRGGILVSASLVQATAIVLSRMSGTLSETKMVMPPLEDAIRGTLYHQVIAPVLGRTLGDPIASALNVRVGAGVELTLAMLAAGLASLAIYKAFPSGQVAVVGYLSAAWVLLAALTNYGAHGGLGWRYSVVSGFIVLMLLIHAALHSRRWALRIAAALLLLTSFAVGVREYRMPVWTDPNFRCEEECPDWRREVARYREDPNASLQIWPYPRWSFVLGPQGGREGDQ